LARQEWAAKIAIPATRAAAIVPMNIATMNGSVFRSFVRIGSSPIPNRAIDTDSARIKSVCAVKSVDNKSGK
jgi:hypothetical protein